MSDCSSDSDTHSLCHDNIRAPPQPVQVNQTPRPLDASTSTEKSSAMSASNDAPLPKLSEELRQGKPPPASLAPGAAKERFKRVVHRVIAIRRASSPILAGQVGAEPGIDPRRASAHAHYGHIRQQCVIEMVDYSVTRSSFGRMTNRELVELLRSPRASKREPWARVRWINVSGISWDVISALALRYDMHPLAIEDVLHQHGHGRSKVDYYPKHLFLRLLCHRLGSDDDWLSPDSTLGHLPLEPSILNIPQTESFDHTDEKGFESEEEERTVYGDMNSSTRFSTRRRMSTLAMDVEAMKSLRPIAGHPSFLRTPSFMEKVTKKKVHAQDWKLVQKLKKGQRVNVKIYPVCIFLFRDGTVISISQDSKSEFTAPIRERLRQSHSGLRRTADPSLLVQSLIDLIVDQALEVVEEYQGRILKIEKDVLLKPDMKTVTSLHMLQADLILHKRTIEPIKTLVSGLRRYDADRAAAMAESYSEWDAEAKPVGYMSNKAKIYLADVSDHLEYILMSLDMFASISDNLINYTCNMVSYQMNEVMRRLTLATIIFLPLTFLSGYFGMNFTRMWSVQNNSDVLFWEIALPVMVVVVPIFMWPDLRRMVHYIEKRIVRHTIQKTIKQD